MDHSCGVSSYSENVDDGIGISVILSVELAVFTGNSCAYDGTWIPKNATEPRMMPQINSCL